MHPTFATIADVIGKSQPVVVTVRFVPAAWVGGAAVSGIVGDTSASHVSAHAVLVVGHSPVSYLGVDEDALIFKNSWGMWGQNGYGYLTKRYIDRHIVCAHQLESVA